jgi:hypothetical protein
MRVLGIANLKSEYLAAPVGGHPGGDHHRLRHHPTVDAGLAVGGIEKHIRKRLPRQGPVAERADLGIQVGADPRQQYVLNALCLR